MVFYGHGCGKRAAIYPGTTIVLAMAFSTSTKVTRHSRLQHGGDARANLSALPTILVVNPNQLSYRLMENTRGGPTP